MGAVLPIPFARRGSGALSPPPWRLTRGWPGHSVWRRMWIILRSPPPTRVSSWRPGVFEGQDRELLRGLFNHGACPHQSPWHVRPGSFAVCPDALGKYAPHVSVTREDTQRRRVRNREPWLTRPREAQTRFIPPPLSGPDCKVRLSRIAANGYLRCPPTTRNTTRTPCTALLTRPFVATAASVDTPSPTVADRWTASATGCRRTPAR